MSNSLQKSPLRYIVLFIVGILIFVKAVVLFNTLSSEGDKIFVEPAININIDKNAASERLASAVRFKTISDKDTKKIDSHEFTAMHKFFEKSFPLVHNKLLKNVVGEQSLLYEWKGSNINKKPILLMGHQDVVPVAQSTEDKWVHPPFDGVISDGYIWGRGTLDNKCSVVGILEAVESLLNDGFEPRQTIYLSFGHDEEVGGNNGTYKVVELLKSRDVELEYVLDEGGIITEGMFPGIKQPVAIIGIAEKGYISLELTVEGTGGHSSMPPRETTIGILSKALSRLEVNPFQPRLNGVAALMFEELTPNLPFPQKLAFSNLWLFRTHVLRKLTGSPKTNAMVRTTTAPTMLQGSDKENVLPLIARAVVNFRILPGDTTESVRSEVTRIVNDSRVKIDPLELKIEPSPVSDINTPFYAALEKSIRQVSDNGNVVVAPYLVVGATDSRHFITLTKNIYRFIGITLNSEDLSGLHGINERIKVDEYIRAVKLYYQLIRNINKA